MTTINNNRPSAPLLPRQANGDQNANVRQASRQLTWFNQPEARQTFIDLANLIRQILGQLNVKFPAPGPAPAPLPNPQPVYGVIQPPDIIPVYGVVLPPDGMVQPVYGVIQQPVDPIVAQPVYGVIQPDVPDVSLDTPIQAVYGSIAMMTDNQNQ